jgi:hypothetical protein
MANIISGKSGVVKTGGTPTALVDIAMWSIEVKAQENVHATNSTGGWKTRSIGVKNATGKIKAMQNDDAAVGLVVGNTYAAQFHIDGSGSNYYSGSIVITGFDGYEVDMNDGKEVAATFSWGCNGAITANGDVPALV